MLNIKTFEVNPLHENCYVVSDDTTECVIIDCGAFTPEEQNEIIEYIKSEGLKPKHLVATHGHFDHNLGIDAMYKEFGLKLEIHRGDERVIREIKEQAEAMCGIIVGFVPQIGQFLNGNDEICFGSHTLKVIATPGHSMGGVCYYCEEEGVLFSGDTLFRLSIGRTDFPGGSMFMIINSLRYLCQLPDSVTVYPGHGPQTNMGYEVAHNPYLDR
ncbi:MBL fold metallo-hydrolase [Palleniella muris]|uniref:MBL fold metallo-hydrolase n=1 Tax=Palleniella muris TaxID=3038145 RepID=A0AC61QTA8_9BACT|nr:MBL fold metallo-hydrolase [Palleniella muris]TGX83496.1 MBL fold metallo-hydrolase [Palleniella muris]